MRHIVQQTTMHTYVHTCMYITSKFKLIEKVKNIRETRPGVSQKSETRHWDTITEIMLCVCNIIIKALNFVHSHKAALLHNNYHPVR